MTTPPSVGLLLVSLGTPDAPEAGAVRRYLREFLSDPRVLDLPPLRRFLLLELLILPLRPRRAAAAYRKIWTAAGSPLLTYARALTAKVQARLSDPQRKPAVQVELAMRYGQPSIAQALDRFAANGVDHIVLLPLYPQYSAAATGSTIARVLELAGQRWNTPYVQVVPPFFDQPAYLDARVAVTGPILADRQPEQVFMSFHGLPERHLQKSDARGGHCLRQVSCCAELSSANRWCYRAQCLASARLLAERLDLPPERITVSFQSRLGRSPWIKPYTDEVLATAAQRGMRNAVILSPGFVLDCLETLEELGIRGQELWREHGGESLTLVPALNDSDAFADAVVAIARQQSSWLDGRPDGRPSEQPWKPPARHDARS